MPTTRQKRYEFYRNRQLRRHRRMWGTKARGLLSDPGVGKHVTRRGFDHAGWELQIERSYPIDRYYRCTINHAISLWVLPPRRGQWGVPAYTPVYPPWW